MPTPTGATPFFTLTQLSISPLTNSLLYGTAWANDIVTFSFPDIGSYFLTGYQENNSDYHPLSANQRTVVRSALASWQNVADIFFFETTDTLDNVGDLRFAFSWTSENTAAQAWAYAPGVLPNSGDVWFNKRSGAFTDSWTPGSYNYETAVHEIGHALGLKHPDDPSNYVTQLLSAEYDVRSFTVMSYKAAAGDETTRFSYEPTTPMILDIAAIQFLYGANTSFNSTDTFYNVSGTATYHETIWDAGGTDTIIYNSITGGTINLTPGVSGGSILGIPVYAQNSIGQNLFQAKNIWISDDVWIENATGSTGDDTLIGNAINNVIKGMGGNDILTGMGGSDTLTGGDGSDTFYFYKTNNGTDSIQDFSEADQILVDGLTLSGVITAGSGSGAGLGAVQILTGTDSTAVYIGTDASPGADLALILTGAIQASQFHVIHGGLTFAPLPSLSIIATSASQNEGNSSTTNLTFTVTRSGDTSGASSANWVVSSASASGADFTAGVFPSGAVNFAAGETSKLITVSVTGDSVVEPDEPFKVTLSGVSGATLGTSSANGTILNDDAGASLSIAATNANQNEGNSGSKNFTFAVTRTGDTSGASSANWVVSSMTATGSDFASGALPSGSVSFAAGETSKTVSVSVAGDVTVEADETFTVTLSAATGATLTTPTASGTIVNDDSVPLPTMAIAATSASLSEGNSGSKNFTFTVTRTGDTSGASSANWAVSSTTATGSDFASGVLPSGSVSFAAGETSKTVSVSVAGDVTVEADETFTVTLSAATGATLTTPTASGTIVNDDSVPLPTMAIAATDVNWYEGSSGATPYWFTISRTGDASSASSVKVSVGGSAVSGDDFIGGALPSGVFDFAPGETSKTFYVLVAGDTTVELDEVFTVSLSDASGATISTQTASATIWNDDSAALPTLAIAAVAASVNEGNSGTTNYTFTVTRTGDTSGASSAHWAVSSASASGADFTGGVLPSGTVSFAAGETSKTITVPVSGDTTLENDEPFTVTLSDPSNATLAETTADGMIVNDDALPSLSIAPANANQNEGNSGTTSYTFTVTRSGDTLSASSTGWAVSSSTASGADFVGGVLPSGTVNFAVGETSKTVTVPVSGDTTVETDETFTVTLSDPSGATLAGTTANGTIVNDDALPSLSIAPANANQAEGNSGTTNYTFTVTRSGDTSGASSANWAVGSATATGTDFVGGVFPSGMLSFAAGETSATITVQVSSDTAFEPDETFTVTLSAPSGATLVGSTANGTITNDDALPSLSIAPTNANQNEGNSGTTNYTFTVARSGDTSGASSANWAVSSASATDTDFVGGVFPSGTVSFAAGETSATITVQVSSDMAFEPDETFTVTLSDPTDAALAGTTANGTILNDDALPNLSIAAFNANQAEGNNGTTNYTFTVTRSGDTSGASSTNWAVTSDTATGTDFVGGVLPSGTVNFAVGETSKTITVPVNGDTAFEPDEPFTVTLSAPTGATLVGSTANGIIANEDALPSLSIAPTNANQNEGNSGTTSYTFTVTRSGDTSGASSTNWAVSSSTASGQDFVGGVFPFGTVSFAAGETSKTITVQVSGDTAFESDETFTVTLSAPSDATLAGITANGTIVNDDALPSLSVAPTNANQPEGNSGTTSYTFTVTRSGDTSGASSTNWQVSSATATGTDFVGGVFPSGTVSFAAGEASKTFTVPVSGDSAFEADEPFTVTLSAPSGATLAGTTANGTIVNDDALPSLSIAPTNANLAEGNSGTANYTFTVTRSGDTSGASSTNWAVSSTTATGSDFVGGVLPSGTVSFAAGETSKAITVPVSGDTVFEANETFSVTLSTPSNATLGTVTANGTIVNDDASAVPGITRTGTAGIDTLTGSAGDDTINGLAGNDILMGLAGNDLIDGGTGIDTARYDVPRAQAAIDLTATTPPHAATVTVPGLGTDTLSNVERLRFSDLAVAFDVTPTGNVDDPATKGIGGNGGKAYRLYQAALARTPDLGGLGYWIAQVDEGATLFNLASGFLGSPEFASKYGANPTNQEYTRALYLNVLGREPDADGYAYWNALLDGKPFKGVDYGATSRQQMLVDFSEGKENKALVIEIIGNGFDYLPWG